MAGHRLRISWTNDQGLAAQKKTGGASCPEEPGVAGFTEESRGSCCPEEPGVACCTDEPGVACCPEEPGVTCCPDEPGVSGRLTEG